MEKYDLTKPIELAEDVFWIGYVIPNDPFQCHVYLIRNDEESILIDPGSMITFPIVLDKIFQVVPLKKIKYIILHHQDPDIVGCFSTLESLFPKGKMRFIVTHWRTKTLLKHYQWRTPFYLIDRHDWKLLAGDRELEFIFTPYAHFPGAFCTFDKRTKTLFSSDIFGAISDKFFLFAVDDEDYYKGVELFHKHYMPSKAILNYALDKIEEKNPELIAPQHGSIIKKEMINPVISRLRLVDCGLYMLEDKTTDIFLLNKLDETLKRLFNSIISSSDFRTLVKRFFNIVKDEIPTLEKVLVVGQCERGGCLAFEIDGLEVREKFFLREVPQIEGFSYKEILETDSGVVGTVYIFADKLKREELEFLSLLFKHIKYALAASLEREVKYEFLEKEAETLKRKAVIDPLTGLYNRRYLFDYLSQVLNKANSEGFPVSVAVIDIDFFKKVNDTYGHLVGDCVLKDLAKILKSSFRSSDCIARYGGEEFVVVLPNSPLSFACRKMEMVRKKVEESTFKCEGFDLKLTVSIGVTEYRSGESVESLLKRADMNLYEAKRAGRNRVVCL